MAPKQQANDDLSISVDGDKAFDRSKDASNNASLIPEAGKVLIGK